MQSVAPVRKSFIDAYPGPMLIIDSTRPNGILDPSEVLFVARQHDYRMSVDEATRLCDPLIMHLMADQVRPHVASVDPIGAEPTLAEPVEQYLLTRTRRHLGAFRRRGCNNPLLRGFELQTWADWWPLFFYRFVDPRSRMGDRLNYADRIKSARAQILPTAWVLYHCPPLSR